MDKVKKCSGCKTEKVITDFTRNKNKKDGRSGYCKNCEKEQRYLKSKVKKMLPLEKKCGKCCIIKNSKDFPLNNLTKDGLYSYCKACKSELYYTPKPRIELVDLKNSLKTCPKCKLPKVFSEFSTNKNLKAGLEHQCKECKKRYRKENKKLLASYTKKYRDANIEKCKKIRRDYYRRNKYKNKAYREKNKEYLNEKYREYQKVRELENPLFKLSNRVRTLVRISLNRFLENGKSKKTVSILGCELKEFFNHIESQFSSWMTWDNYGKYTGNKKESWDLDHIIPVSYAKTEDELLELNHWSNFQPLCSFENRYEKKDTLYPLTNLELNKTFL